MSSNDHLSHKQEARIRTGSGEVKSLPTDLHAELSEQKTVHGYETMWGTAVQAMRHGVKIMRAQNDRANEIINSAGSIGNFQQQRRS